MKRCTRDHQVGTAGRILFSGLGGRKAPNSMDKISIFGVLRLRATKRCLRDRSVRRCAQDDVFVGVLKANIQNKLALMGLSHGLCSGSQSDSFCHRFSRTNRPFFRVYSRTGNGLIPAAGGRDVQTGIANSGMGLAVKNFRVYRDSQRAPEFAFFRRALSVLIPVPAYIFR